MTNDIVERLGYFDEAGQVLPAHDPGENVACPSCGEPVGRENVKARCLMLVGGERSYFFRYHKKCKDDPAIQQFEWDAIEEIEGWEEKAQ